MSTERIDAVLRNCRGLVLDLGCAGQADRRSQLDSRYWLHGRLIAKFPNAWGLEFSERNAEELLASGIQNIVIGDAQDFSLEQKFDTIVAGEIIEHLPNPGGMLRSAAEHLNVNGRLIITTPYVFGFGFSLYAWAKFPRTCSNDDHTMWFCPATMGVLAQKCGLEVESFSIVDDRRSDLESSWARAYARAKPIMRMMPIHSRASNMVHVLRVAESMRSSES